MAYKIINVSFHTDKKGNMIIMGMRDSGYPFEMRISSSNPLTSIQITNEYLIFRAKEIKAEYCIYYRDIDMLCQNRPERKMNWSGCDKPAPTSMIYFLHDLIAEVKYNCFVKTHTDTDIPMEVEYLKERYIACDKYISKLKFEIMINELVRAFQTSNGVPQQ